MTNTQKLNLEGRQNNVIKTETKKRKVPLSKTTLNVLLDIHINEKATGYDIIKRQGVASGVLYPILQRELENGNLTVIKSVKNNKPRHMYSLTQKGYELILKKER